MGNRGSANPKNWGAIHRKRRKADAARVSEPSQQTPPAGVPNFTIKHGVFRNNSGPALHIGEGVHVQIDKGSFSNNDPAHIDNAGRLDGGDLTFD